MKKNVLSLSAIPGYPYFADNAKKAVLIYLLGLIIFIAAGLAVSKAPILTLTISIYLCYLFLVFMRPEFGLMLAITTTPFYNFLVFHTPIADFRFPVVMWITILSVLVIRKRFSLKVIRARCSEFIGPVALIASAYLLSLINSSNAIVTARESLQIIYLSLIPFIIVLLVTNRTMMQKVIIALAVSLTVLVVLGFLTFTLNSTFIPRAEITVLPGGSVIDTTNTELKEQTAGMGTVLMRASSSYLGPVGTANILLQGSLIFCCFLLIRTNSLRLWQKLWYGALVIASTSLMVLTFSRAAWLFFVSLVFLLLIIARNPRGLLIIGLLLLSSLVFLPYGEGIQARFVEILNPTSEGSVRSHLALYQSALRIFLDAPIFGVGAGLFKEAVVDMTDIYARFDVPLVMMDAHNFFLQILAETGIIGFTGLVWLLWRYFRTLWQSIKLKIDKPERVTTFAFMFAGVGACLMNLTMNAFAIEFFWVILGLGFAAAKASNNQA